MRQPGLQGGEGEADRSGELRVDDRIGGHRERALRDTGLRQRAADGGERVMGRDIAVCTLGHFGDEAATPRAAIILAEAQHILRLAAVEPVPGAPDEDVERARRVAQHDRVAFARVGRHARGGEIALAAGAGAQRQRAGQHGENPDMASGGRCSVCHGVTRHGVTVSRALVLSRR